MKTIENKAMCKLKKLHIEFGSTFQDVERAGIESPLYECVKCDEEYSLICENYREDKR